MTGLIVDNFAGGGGASTGIEQALGRAVDQSAYEQAKISTPYPGSTQ